jgi:hypothetical protein
MMAVTASAPSVPARWRARSITVSELGIGRRLERAVDLCKARARAQQEGEDLLRQCLAFGLRERLNLGDE